MKREYERVNRKAFEVYKEDIAKARELIKDTDWNSEDESTLRSY